MTATAGIFTEVVSVVHKRAGQSLKCHCRGYFCLCCSIWVGKTKSAAVAHWDLRGLVSQYVMKNQDLV